MSIWEILLIIGLAPIAWVVVPALLKIMISLPLVGLVYIGEYLINAFIFIRERINRR